MHVLSVAEMQRCDAETIQGIGVPAMVLVERAAWSAFQLITTCWPAISAATRPILVLAGPGNNGADGLALARMLHLAHLPVQVYAMPARTDEAMAQTAILARLGVTLPPLGPDAWPDPAACSLVVDGLFGVGLNRPLAPWLGTLADTVRQSGTACLALDMPSGLDGNTGQALGQAFTATRTVTFGWPKTGLLTDAAAENAGELWVADIGLPAALAAKGGRRINEAHECQAMLDRLSQRRPDSHKGDYGRVLIIGGSPTMPGAVLMTIAAALAAGAGYVTAAIPENLIPMAATRFPAAMFHPLGDSGYPQLLEQVAAASVVAIGPGLGRHQATADLVAAVLARAPGTVVLDADGLNVTAAHPDWVKHRQAPTILTPHAGEAGRWLDLNTDQVQADRWSALDKLVARTAATVVLKGSRTLIGAPDGRTWVNVSGTPALARGGSGDVLTGLIASLAAQGMAPADAARTAVWWHGCAAEAAVTAHGVLPATWERLLEALSAGPRPASAGPTGLHRLV